MERLDALSRGTPRTDLPAFDAGDTVRVMVRVREGDKERLQAFEGIVHLQAGRRRQRELHRPEGLGGRGRGAHLPGAEPDHRLDRDGAARPGAPGQAVLPPRAERQSGAHQGAARELVRWRPAVRHWPARRAVWAEGLLLVGVDEAGRGPLAGPVVAAAVVFPAGSAHAGRRPGQQDTARGAARGAGPAHPGRGDRRRRRRGVGPGNRRAQHPRGHGARHAPRRRTVVACTSPRPRFPACCSMACGCPSSAMPHDALVDGDAHCHSIAAAGILAKTVRDRLMRQLAGRHGDYGWERNCGYGSAEHLAAIELYGPTAHHRRSFRPVSGMGLPTWPARRPCPDWKNPPARS